MKKYGDLSNMKSLEEIIFNLDNENIRESAQAIFNLFGENYVYTIFTIVCRLIYSSFISQMKDYHIYFMFLKKLETKYKKKCKYHIIKIFQEFLLYFDSQESNYLLEKMFEEKLIDFDTLSRKLSLYFIHLMKISKGEINNPKIIEILVKYENNFRKQSEYYVIHKKFKKIHLINKNYFSNFYFKLREKYATGEENKSVNSDPLDNCFFENYEKLSKNDWKLHKKYVKKGHNPNEIAKIIRNDEIEKLQEISSQLNFDFNQKIKPSLYERYSFINQENVTLIDYAAFFSAVKCFKYLLMNDADIYHTFKYAVAGGNLEIIHLCEQNHSPFEGAYETAIEFHRNDIFQYLYENKLGKIYSLEKLGVKCVLNNSYQILSFLIEKANLIKSNTIIHAIILSGNLFLMISLFGPYNFENIFDLCIKSQNVELVEYFFKLGKIDVNELLADGQTSLMIASKCGDSKIVKFFLEQEGVDINVKDDYNTTPLMFASKKGNIKVVKLLVEQKEIDVNAKDIYGKTALLYAAENSDIEIVKLLLKQENIDFNAKDNYGRTALIYASQNGDTEIVKLLLEKDGIDINAQGDLYKRSALMKASENGYIEIVKLLLEQKGIDINAKDAICGSSILMIVCSKVYIEIVKLLLEHKGIDINAKNGYKQTALIHASLIGSIEIVKLLLEQEGIDINAKDSEGETALIHASYKGHTEIVKLLLEQEGIDINAKDKDGDTALNLAIQNNNTTIIKLLKK